VQSLVSTLRPIADRLAKYKADSSALKIATDADAERAAALRDQMVQDCTAAVDAINNFMPDQQGVGLIARLNAVKNRLTGFRNIFAEIDTFAKTVKRKILDYEDAKKAAAEQERARLQAEADAKARREQEALLAKAAKMKTPEKQQEYQERAAMVLPPVIHIPVATTGTKSAERLVVMKCDLLAMGVPREIAGYFKVELFPDGRFREAVLSAEKLCAAKSANSMLEIKGCEFRKIRV